jgi:Zn finger protein HypA/HybF involved in hydrogenase expression
MPAKKDFDEVKRVFAVAGLDLMAEFYPDSKTPLSFVCRTCTNPGKITFNQVQQGQGCRYCGIKSAARKRKTDIETVCEKFKAKNLNLLDNLYRNAKQKLRYKCNSCGNLGEISLEKLNVGRGCKKCGIKRRGLSSRLTKEQVKKRLADKKLKLISEGESVSWANENLNLECRECGNKFEEKFTRVSVYRFPCPNCRNNQASIRANSLRADIRKVRSTFENLGLELLTSCYSKSGNPLPYRCIKCGYLGEKTYNDASVNGTGCRNCGIKTRAEKSKMSADAIRQVANMSRVEILEEVLRVDKRIKVRFIDCGHLQFKSITGLKDGSQCSICSGKQKKNHGDYQDLAALHRGSILKIGKNSHSKSKWRCSVGHEFVKAFSTIKSAGSFCPVCTKKHSEMLAKAILERIFGVPFESHRLRTIRGLGGRYLELDLYNANLRLAVEHHGKQHFIPIEFFGGRKQFERQLVHDERRRQACREAGITLLEINQLGEETSIEELRSKLKSICIQNNINLPSNYDSIDLTKISTRSVAEKYWRETCKLAAERGYQPLSTVYLGVTVKHSWRCSQGHDFEMRPRDIYENRVKNCPKCLRIHREKPVLASDGRLFANETEAGKSLGVSKAAVNYAVRHFRTVKGLTLKRVTQEEFNKLKQV